MQWTNWKVIEKLNSARAYLLIYHIIAFQKSIIFSSDFHLMKNKQFKSGKSDENSESCSKSSIKKWKMKNCNNPFTYRYHALFNRLYWCWWMLDLQLVIFHSSSRVKKETKQSESFIKNGIWTEILNKLRSDWIFFFVRSVFEIHVRCIVHTDFFLRNQCTITTQFQFRLAEKTPKKMNNQR